MSSVSYGISVSHPLQGLVCAHGYKNKGLHTLPVETIFVSIDSLYTVAKFSIINSLQKSRTITSNDQEITGDANCRIASFVENVFHILGVKENYRIDIKQNFPVGIGLGSSASLFAAITISIVHAFGKSLTIKELSCLARLGSYSAAAAIVGNVSVIRTGRTNQENFAEIICKKDKFPYKMIVFPVIGKKHSEKIHLDMKQSPFYRTWLIRVRELSKKVQEEIENYRFERLGDLVEPYIYENYATISTGSNNLVTWTGETLRKIMFLRELRNKKNIEYFIAMNSGPAVFVYTKPNDLSKLVPTLKKNKIEHIVSSIGNGAYFNNKIKFKQMK